MCLILVSWKAHPDFPLVIAANRDEFYTRKTRRAAWWGQAVSILAGRDEEAGGTWLGICRNGRFAMLTNVRLPTERKPYAPTRGGLVVSALQSEASALPCAYQHLAQTSGYNGFNMLVGDLTARRPSEPARLVYASNRLEGGPQALAPGIYGLSNAFLDTPWPKVTRAVSRFATQLAARVHHDDLFALMADRHLAHDSALPSTGIPIEWERALSAIQIRALGYGTRSTTVITVRQDGLTTFIERSFDPDYPDQFSDRHYEFMVEGMQIETSRMNLPREP